MVAFPTGSRQNPWLIQVPTIVAEGYVTDIILSVLFLMLFRVYVEHAHSAFESRV